MLVLLVTIQNFRLNPDKLSLTVREISPIYGIKTFFVLVYESKEEGWFVGTLNGKTGLIPANYVEPLPGPYT